MVLLQKKLTGECPVPSDEDLPDPDQLSKHCHGWMSATKATPDYFPCIRPNGSTDCISDAKIPNNFKGSEVDFHNTPTTGGYAGIYVHKVLFDPNPEIPRSWSEYIKGDLTTTLIPGNSYRVSFNASLSKSALEATKLGFRL